MFEFKNDENLSNKIKEIKMCRDCKSSEYRCHGIFTYCTNPNTKCDLVEVDAIDGELRYKSSTYKCYAFFKDFVACQNININGDCKFFEKRENKNITNIFQRLLNKIFRK